jgi:hypothetical protein
MSRHAADTQRAMRQRQQPALASQPLTEPTTMQSVGVRWAGLAPMQLKALPHVGSEGPIYGYQR